MYDFPDGSLESAQQRIHNSNTDISLAMYYAHWDGTSLSLAGDLQSMARSMAGKVSIVCMGCLENLVRPMSKGPQVCIYFKPQVLFCSDIS